MYLFYCPFIYSFTFVLVLIGLWLADLLGLLGFRGLELQLERPSHFSRRPTFSMPPPPSVSPGDPSSWPKDKDHISLSFFFFSLLFSHPGLTALIHLHPMFTNSKRSNHVKLIYCTIAFDINYISVCSWNCNSVIISSFSPRSVGVTTWEIYSFRLLFGLLPVFPCFPPQPEVADSAQKTALYTHRPPACCCNLTEKLFTPTLLYMLFQVTYTS